MIVFENASSFTSTFYALNGIENVRCSRYYPSSKGLVELVVEAIKNSR